MTVPVQGIRVRIAPDVLFGYSRSGWYSPREVPGLLTGPQVVFMMMMIGAGVVLRQRIVVSVERAGVATRKLGGLFVHVISTLSFSHFSNCKTRLVL